MSRGIMRSATAVSPRWVKALPRIRAFSRQENEKSYSCDSSQAVCWFGVSTSARSASVSSAVSTDCAGDRGQRAVDAEHRRQSDEVRARTCQSAASIGRSTVTDGRAGAGTCEPVRVGRREEERAGGPPLRRRPSRCESRRDQHDDATRRTVPGSASVAVDSRCQRSWAPSAGSRWSRVQVKRTAAPTSGTRKLRPVGLEGGLDRTDLGLAGRQVPLVRDAPTEKTTIAARMPRMMITMRSSMSVKPSSALRRRASRESAMTAGPLREGGGPRDVQETTPS
jgi:hypothetical protein